MLIVSYDISDNKRRTRFSKFLEKHGTRLQYSVFEIKNSKRVLNNIVATIKNEFEPKFTGADSIVVFRFDPANMLRFGYAQDRDKDLISI